MIDKSYVVNVEGAILRGDRYLLVIRGPEETHATGTLALVGGKVETDDPGPDILESTLRREIREEVGLDVDQVIYVHSSLFFASDGDPVIDIVFLCLCENGTPRIDDPGEVAELLWLTPDEVMRHPASPVWTQRSIQRAEAIRVGLRDQASPGAITE